MIMLQNIKKLYTGQSSSQQSVIEGVDLIINGDKIEDISLHNPDKKFENEIVVIDASSFFIVPGLVDCHNHAVLTGVTAKDLHRSNSELGLLYLEKSLFLTLAYGGTTTIQDTGGAIHMHRRMVDAKVMMGPRMKISIVMLSSTGGHGDFLGPERDSEPMWASGKGRPSNLVDGPWDCRKKVRELIACGADFIKVCASTGVASPSDDLDHEDISREELRAICDEAAKRGRFVVVHSHTKPAIKEAILAGVKQLHHISFMDEETAKLAAQYDCYIVPTRWAIAEVCGGSLDKVDSFVANKMKRALSSHQDAVNLAIKHDLKILAGTDDAFPGMAGRNYMELVHLVRAGVPLLRAWYGATGLAAKAIGFDEVGVIDAGKKADLIVCDQDVIADPEKFEQGAIREVIKDGEGYRGFLAKIPQRSFASGALELMPPHPVNSFAVDLPI